MRYIPCGMAGSRGCSISDARRCLRGSSPSFRGPSGESFYASRSHSAFRTLASVNTRVRPQSTCGRWTRSRRRSPGARSSCMSSLTSRYTTRLAGFWQKWMSPETMDGLSAGSATDVGGSSLGAEGPYATVAHDEQMLDSILPDELWPLGSNIGYDHQALDR